jgi:hypothetical protein
MRIPRLDAHAAMTNRRRLLQAAAVGAGGLAGAAGAEIPRRLVAGDARGPRGEDTSMQALPPHLAFTRSWNAGTHDAAGRRMNGTEVVHLVSHGGRLFAGTSLWMEQAGDIDRACQVLVLDAAGGNWRVDHTFAAGNPRLTGLRSVTFATDGSGRPIEPVSMLLAAPDTESGSVALFCRDDATGRWEATTFGAAARASTTRAIGFHRDRVTGVDLVFAGNRPLGTFAGTFDAAAPGRIAWRAAPEFVAPTGERMMSFCECAGDLYCSTSRHVFHRIDGPAPRWEKVFFVEESTSVGIRGLGTVPDPAGGGDVLLLSARNRVRRLDPRRGFAETVELDYAEFVTAAFGMPATGALAAYDEFTPWSVPGSGETVWLFGFQASYHLDVARAHPQRRWFVRTDARARTIPQFAAFAAEGRYFVRRVTPGGVRFEIGEIDDPTLPVLVSTRAIVPSPFAAEADRVLYMGGFDCNFQPSHDTGWIYRAEFT